VCGVLRLRKEKDEKSVEYGVFIFSLRVKSSFRHPNEGVRGNHGGARRIFSQKDHHEKLEKKILDIQAC